MAQKYPDSHYQHYYVDDVAGRMLRYHMETGVINPTAMVLSAKMMLDHFGNEDEAKALE